MTLTDSIIYWWLVVGFAFAYGFEWEYANG